MTSLRTILSLIAACLIAACVSSQPGFSEGEPARPPAVEGAACRFDVESLAFQGSPLEQAACLLRPVGRYARLGEALSELPPGIAGLPGQTVTISRESLREHLRTAGIDEEDIGGSLDEPLSRADTNNPAAPPALYFVIHDTSTPNLLSADFPPDINEPGWRHNALGVWDRGDDSVAHVFINRVGESLTALDFSTPWRATRLESRVLGTVSRGRFLHIELVQPRRSDPRGPEGNDALAPEPGFTDPQLERLALVYVAASVRGGSWLVPAFHAVVDNGIAGAHDDPQRFDLERWSRMVGELVERLRAH